MTNETTTPTKALTPTKSLTATQVKGYLQGVIETCDVGDAPVKVGELEVKMVDCDQENHCAVLMVG